MKELVFNNPFPIKVHLMDDGFLLLQWPDQINDEINDDVLALASVISQNIEYTTDVVPAYASLGIFYDSYQIDHHALIEKIKLLPKNKKIHLISQIISVPVCYDPKYAIDMDHITSFHQKSQREIIDLHTSADYRVSFIGFLPGFMYLSGMDEKLITPRRAIPRTIVPQGAVAIGGNQTGVYPSESPGGWQIIGRCPLRLFDKNAEVPSRFSAGAQIKMIPISSEEFDTIHKKEYSRD